jgi:hypothetical protein
MLLNSDVSTILNVYKFSVHLHSDILRWISVELFLTGEPLAHATAMWQFLVMFYPPPSPTTAPLGPQKAKINKSTCFIELLPTCIRQTLRIVRVLTNSASNKINHWQLSQVF